MQKDTLSIVSINSKMLNILYYNAGVTTMQEDAVNLVVNLNLPL